MNTLRASMNSTALSADSGMASFVPLWRLTILKASGEIIQSLPQYLYAPIVIEDYTPIVVAPSTGPTKA